MEKTKRIVKILFGILGLPVGLITFYNLYRQELNLSAPPLISILPDWHWAVWLSILLSLIVFRLLFEIYSAPLENKLLGNKKSTTSNQADNHSNAVSVTDSPNASITIGTSKELPLPTFILEASNADQVSSSEIILHLKEVFNKPDIESEVNKKRKELLDGHVFKESEVAQKYTPTSAIEKAIYGVIRSYPSRVEEYIKNYRNYLVENYTQSILDDRYKEVELNIICKGRPATNIVLDFIFPDDFPFPPYYVTNLVEMNRLVYKDKDGRRFTKKIEITPPQEPSQTLPKIKNAYDFDNTFVPLNRRINSGKMPYSRRGKNVARLKFNNFVNNLPNNLPPLLMWLEDVDKQKNWIISYIVYANELTASPHEGTIEIKAIVK